MFYPGYFEETEDCSSVGYRFQKPLPFKLKYLWSKNPCDKCLVKAACIERFLVYGSSIKCKLKEDFFREEKSARGFVSFLKNIPTRPSFIISSWMFMVGMIFFIFYLYEKGV
jgi:hypothetical protein